MGNYYKLNLYYEPAYKSWYLHEVDGYYFHTKRECLEFAKSFGDNKFIHVHDMEFQLQRTLEKQPNGSYKKVG